MTANRIAIIVGVIIVIILVIWGFANLRPFLGSLFGGPSGRVTVGEHTFTVTVADDPDEREAGLSKKTSLPEDQGMLFVFEKPGNYPFWMKEMQFPLDIIFITDDKVVTIYPNVQPPETESASLPLYRPTAPADKVLEINAGLAEQYGIKQGDTVQVKL
jgi:uncharacterized membrane protein (UPF0127 family)